MQYPKGFADLHLSLQSVDSGEQIALANIAIHAAEAMQAVCGPSADSQQL